MKRLGTVFCLTVLTVFSLYAASVDKNFKTNLDDPFREIDILIIGAGPTGIAAAIEAAAQGARVGIIEHRSHADDTLHLYKNHSWASRDRYISLDEEAVKNIIIYLESHLPDFTPFTQLSIYDNYGRAILKGQTYRKITRFLKLNRHIGGFIKLKDLEQWLWFAAARLTQLNSAQRFEKYPGLDAAHVPQKIRGGVFTMFDSVVTDLTGKFVLVKNNAGITESFSPLAIVIADGANSETLKWLEMKRVPIEGMPTSEWLVASFKSEPGSKGESKFDFRRDDAHPFFGIALVTADITTVYCSPHAGSFAEVDQEAIIKETARRMDVRGIYQNDVTFFSGQVDRSEKTHVRVLRAVIAGDALHKFDPFTGFGVSSAIYGVKSIGRFVEKILKSKGDNIDQIFSEYDSDMQKELEIHLKQNRQAQILKWFAKTKWIQKVIPFSALVNTYDRLFGQKVENLMCHSLF